MDARVEYSKIKRVRFFLSDYDVEQAILKYCKSNSTHFIDDDSIENSFEFRDTNDGIACTLVQEVDTKGE